jgi:hypothetical protein
MSKTLWNGVRKGCSCGHTQSTTHPQGTTQPPPPAEQPTEITAWSDAPLGESDPDESEGSARLAVTRPRITGPSWAGGATTASSREELLPWFGGTAIPAALVTGTPWAGGPTTTASREHLLSKGRTGQESKECQGARQTSSNDDLHRC